MNVILMLFFMQATYSFLSTCRINDAVGNNTIKYVTSAALSDLVKYGITATIAVEVVLNDQWIVIVTTVFGGVVGNTVGHKFRVK